MSAWRLEIEFEAHEGTADWLFDEVADLVHNTEDITDPSVSLQPEGDPQ